MKRIALIATKSVVCAAVLAIISAVGTRPACAQLPGLKQFDPFNRNSQVRRRGAALEKALRVEGGNAAQGFKNAHGLPNPLNQGSTRFHGRSKVQFRYTIVNTTRRTVEFRLPGGKKRALVPNERRSYIFTGDSRAALIHVSKTNARYRLQGGNHKFWTMSNGRIGFDMNYDRKKNVRRPSSSSRPRR